MVYSRRPHPVLPDYDVVTFDTRVHHELMVGRGVSDDDLIQLVVDYILQYESAYPETEDPSVWAGLVSKLPSSTGEEGELA
jgi:hypothetical protein